MYMFDIYIFQAFFYRDFKFRDDIFDILLDDWEAFCQIPWGVCFSAGHNKDE